MSKTCKHKKETLHIHTHIDTYICNYFVVTLFALLMALLTCCVSVFAYRYNLTFMYAVACVYDRVLMLVLVAFCCCVYAAYTYLLFNSSYCAEP